MAKIMLNGVDYSAPVSSGVSGVKGNAETSYRTGNVNITPENIGAMTASKGNSAYTMASNAYIRLQTNRPYIGEGSSASSSNSVAIGYYANASGEYAIAIGPQSNSKSSRSIALGEASTASGSASVALGRGTQAFDFSSTALGSNTRASDNYSAAIGSQANANGNQATALGAFANASNYCSTSLGSQSATSGYGATALGYRANASGPNSTALGFGSSARGNYSTAIGFGASAGNGSTALGDTAVVSSEKERTIQLGNASSLSELSCRVALTVTSDERDKADITEIDDGAVEFLKKIRAIRYVFNHRELYIDEASLSENQKKKKETYGLCEYDREAHARGDRKGNRVRVGVSAQETQKALREVYGSLSYANLVNDNLFDLDPDEIPEGVENQLSANYEGFIPFLIKAVQELSEKLEAVEELTKGAETA